MAQKEESKLLVKLRVACRRKSREGVIGNLGCGGVPMARLIPVSNDFNGQLSSRGLGNPNSLCKMPMILR